MNEKPPINGIVIAVCIKPQGGIPKNPRKIVTFGDSGIQGDYHAGPIDKHKKSGPPQRNLRQVSVVAKEVLDYLNIKLGICLKPGDLGENVLLQGHGNLSSISPGDRIQLGEEVVLEVTNQNQPCNTINIHHPDLVKTIDGQRGILAMVIQTGTVEPGNPSKVLVTSQTNRS